MRALITGATGFIGSHLVSELRRLGWQAVCLVRRDVEWNDKDIFCIKGDLLNPDSLDLKVSRIGQIDVIFHLGAVLPSKGQNYSTSQYRVANTLSTIKLLEIALNSRIPYFVYASSLQVIGKPEYSPVTENHPASPIHPYLLSKLSAELACEMFRINEGLAVTSLRITSPYGDRMSQHSVLPFFVQQASNSQDIELFGSGQRTQNFVHVKDVVSACLLAANTPDPGVYNIAGPSSISMKALAEMVVRLTPGSKSKIVFGGKPDPQEDYRWEVDLSRSSNRLRFYPRIDLEQGLADYISWPSSRR
ncbi:MAG TPA: NAD(P)-dependent oxidoreductase [archaeon]|nr:NAD(P)-dependent oxidoreductase [archaeon]